MRRRQRRLPFFLEDDLDGGPADETVRFAVGGTDYEIDLNATNAVAFRKQPAPTLNTPAGLATVSSIGRGALPPAVGQRGNPGLGERPGYRA
jgi:hypothetical protein